MAQSLKNPLSESNVVKYSGELAHFHFFAQGEVKFSGFAGKFLLNIPLWTGRVIRRTVLSIGCLFLSYSLGGVWRCFIINVNISLGLWD